MIAMQCTMQLQQAQVQRRSITCEQRRRAPFAVAAAADRSSSQPAQLSRRAALAVPAGLLLLNRAQSAAAFTPPPSGYRLHTDKLDGYSFFFPEDWVAVTTSGNDVFYRNPFNIEENLFVDISSPSSSKFASVRDLGTPEEAAQRTLNQYLDEFLSTRLGVKRTAEVVKASSRIGADEKEYYDIQIRARSYASRAQLAVTQAEIDAALELEWDRQYLATLGVANSRLYQLRLQTSTAPPWPLPCLSCTTTTPPLTRLMMSPLLLPAVTVSAHPGLLPVQGGLECKLRAAHPIHGNVGSGFAQHCTEGK